MASVLSRRDNIGLAANVSGAVLLTLVINGVIFAAGWNSEEQGRVSAEFAPPGWVVGAVWVVLFAAMGAARWLIVKEVTERTTALSLVSSLIWVCALYPFYTGGLDNQFVALAGTIVSFIVAGAAALASQKVSNKAAGLVVPVILWTIFAAALIIREIQLN